MRELLKQINETRIEIALTLEEATELKRMLEKNEWKDGIPTEDGCKCPECGTPLVKDGYRCPCCGQRARYIESDIVPL